MHTASTMSLEIDWGLLSDSNFLAQSFIDKLNNALENVIRPSFLGPVQVTEFDFGTIGPDIEIKDVGDVWKSFIEDDEEADSQDGDLIGASRTPEHNTGPDGPIASAEPSMYAFGQYPEELSSRSGRHDERFDSGPGRSRRSSQDPRYSRANGRRASLQQHIHNDDDETGSVFSGILSPRVSLNRFGAGIGLGSGMGVNLNGGFANGGLATAGYITPALNPSIYSMPISNHKGAARRNVFNNHHHNQHLPYLQNRYSLTHDDMGETQHTPGQADTPLVETPLDPPQPQPLPSIQLLLHFRHTPNIHLTVLTSLQINYPSQMFMSLPLKLTITGLSLNADMVVAFNGAKKRVHLSIIDDFDPMTQTMTNSLASSAVQSPATNTIPLAGGVTSGMPSGISDPHQQDTLSGQHGTKSFGQTISGTTIVPHTGRLPPGVVDTTPSSGYMSPTHSYPYQPYTPGLTTAASMIPEPLKPIGQRLLPALQIESEIGHADVHVLRNVGKVENFILDLVRKTLVDELVFPNYHTVAI
ncbi:hypothetical protein QFC19_004438 [Naganishia cerealis]|uniref:Uncharacterized protein n=1 Tax=Naganishia cerealis TaxID=610337 RepID=A0ACC2VW65_9TREE|nr:hypothetical protein QFC19_004438 [Naganishia cerealis]